MSELLADVTQVSAQVVTAAALITCALALAVTRSPATALAILLELLLAAGLLRLVGDPTWQAVLTAAVIVALRRLLGTALHRSGRPRPVSDGGRGRRLRQLADRARASAAEHLVRPAWRS